jgi:hypothetical protein
MKQHPVPQNVTSYQFRLVGEMTLKQFLELAAGLVVAYLSFHLKLPYIIKWPLIVFAALLGFALAFLPIQERPLDQWIINFIKSIYSPTRYLWRKQNQPPSYLTQPLKIKKAANGAGALLNKSKIQEYLQTLSPRSVATQVFPLDKVEQNKLKQIGLLFKNTDLKSVKVVPVPSPTVSPQTTVPLQKPIIESARPLTPPLAVQSRFKVKQNLKPEVVAMFSDQLAVPAPSQTPNVVVGMVLDTNNRILPNALIEIQNQQGVTVRAIKTNKLGQFFISNPLENGEYKFLTEHDNFQFDIIKLKVDGKIVPPVKIKAKK